MKVPQTYSKFLVARFNKEFYMEMQTESKPVALGDFDPRVVNQRDSKTGRIVQVNPYTMHVIKGRRYFEWPKNSRNLFTEDRYPAGRLEIGQDKQGRPNGELTVKDNEEHVVYVPPMTEDKKVANQLEQSKQENVKLALELEAIKREKEQLLKMQDMKKRAEATEAKQEKHKQASTSKEIKDAGNGSTAGANTKK